jgi:hypothetical protein
MNKKNTVSAVPVTHICNTSVGTEISIPGTNMVFCVDNVSYCNGEIKVEYRFEAKTTKKQKGKRKGKTEVQEFLLLKGCHMFDVSRFTEDKKDTEPIVSDE